MLVRVKEIIIMKFLALILGFALCMGKEFFDLDKSETVEITQNGSAVIRISIKISIGLTYIPANFEPKLEIHNLIGTLIPGNDGQDYQYFDIYCSASCIPGEHIMFNLIQTQGTHLSGHVLHAVMVDVKDENKT